jgi:hypothetical protein
MIRASYTTGQTQFFHVTGVGNVPKTEGYRFMHYPTSRPGFGQMVVKSWFKWRNRHPRLNTVMLQGMMVDSSVTPEDFEDCRRLVIGRYCRGDVNLSIFTDLETLILDGCLLEVCELPPVTELSLDLGTLKWDSASVQRAMKNCEPTDLYVRMGKQVGVDQPWIKQCPGRLSLYNLEPECFGNSGTAAKDQVVKLLMCKDLTLDMDNEVERVDPINVMQCANLRSLHLNWVVAGKLNDWTRLEELYMYKTYSMQLEDQDLSQLCPNLRLFEYCTDDLRIELEEDIVVRCTGHRCLEWIHLDIPNGSVHLADNDRVKELQVSGRTRGFIDVHPGVEYIKVIVATPESEILIGTQQAQVPVYLDEETLAFIGFDDMCQHWLLNVHG